MNALVEHVVKIAKDAVSAPRPGESLNLKARSPLEMEKEKSGCCAGALFFLRHVVCLLLMPVPAPSAQTICRSPFERHVDPIHACQPSCWAPFQSLFISFALLGQLSECSLNGPLDLPSIAFIFYCHGRFLNRAEHSILLPGLCPRRHPRGKAEGHMFTDAYGSSPFSCRHPSSPARRTTE